MPGYLPHPDPVTTSAELLAIVEGVSRSRSRVAGLAEPFLGSEREDVAMALHEAERQLRSAERSVLRAVKTLER